MATKAPRPVTREQMERAILAVNRVYLKAVDKGEISAFLPTILPDSLSNALWDCVELSKRIRLARRLKKGKR